MFFFFSSRRRHTRSLCDWSSDVYSSDLGSRESNLPWQGSLSKIPPPLFSSRQVATLPGSPATPSPLPELEIGRASCRERVYSMGGVRTDKKKKTYTTICGYIIDMTGTVV